MIWYIRLGAFVITAIIVGPFILKTLKLKDEEDPEEAEANRETP